MGTLLNYVRTLATTDSNLAYVAFEEVAIVVLKYRETGEGSIGNHYL